MLKEETKTIIQSNLKGLFGTHKKEITNYIRPGQIYWEFSELENEWKKIKITYIRANVIFYVYVDEPAKEYHCEFGSNNLLNLVPETIDAISVCNLCNYDIDDFKNSVFDDYNGAISIKIILPV